MTLFFYFTIVFLAEIATDLYIPTLPIIAEYYHTTSTQLTMSFHLLGFAIAQPLYGPLSDRYGRKPILLIGFALFIVSSFACALSPTIEFLIAFRFLQGLGACAAPVIALAALKERQTNHIQMLSLLNMTMSLSPILGPVLGSLLLTITNWTSCFYLLGGTGLLLWLGLFSVKEPEAPSKPRLEPPSVQLPFVLSMLANALLVSTVWLFITEAPFILKAQYGISETQYGIYQALSVIGYIAGGYFTHHYSKRIAPWQLITIGVSISLCCAICLSLFTFETALGFTLMIAFFESGIGVLRPPLVNSALDHFPGREGLASSLIGCCEMMISATVIFLLNLKLGIALATSGATLLLLLHQDNPMGITTRWKGLHNLMRSKIND